MSDKTLRPLLFADELRQGVTDNMRRSASTHHRFLRHDLEASAEKHFA